MNFEACSSFRNLLSREYGEVYTHYPSAAYVLDFDLQIRAILKQGSTSFRREDIALYYEATTKVSLATFCYGWYVHFAAMFLSQMKRSFYIHIGFSDEKFPGVFAVIDGVTNELGLKTIDNYSNQKGKLKLLMTKTLSPYQIVMSRRTKKMVLQFKYLGDKDAQKLLSNHKFMSALDHSVSQDIWRLSKLIQRLGIKVFFNSGDSSGPARILIEACKVANAKVITIAHGYFSEPTLIGVMPVHAHCLLLWTKKQVQDVSRAVQHEDKEKVRYIGFPKDFKLDERNPIKNTALLMFGRISEVLNETSKEETLAKLINILEKNGYSVTIRMHPNEPLNDHRLRKFISENTMEISQNSLLDDLSRYELVLGADSSALIEAVSAGCRVIEIQELKSPNYEGEGTQIVSIDNLDNTIQDRLYFSPNDRYKFNCAKFSKGLKYLLEEQLQTKR